MKTKAVAVVILAAALLLSGCGSTSSDSTSSDKVKAKDLMRQGCLKWNSQNWNQPAPKEISLLFAEATRLDLSYLKISEAASLYSLPTEFPVKNPFDYKERLSMAQLVMAYCNGVK